MDQVKTLEDIYEQIGGFGRFQFLAIASVLYPELPSALLLLLPVFVGVTPSVWKCTEISENGTSEYLINSTSILSNDVNGPCSCNGVLSGIGENSIISEWALVCDYAWVTDFITSVMLAGMMIGGIVGSTIADLLGRRKSLYLFCFLMFLMGIASPFVNSPYLYAITRFFLGVGISSYLIINTIYPMEILTPKWRTFGAIGPWAEGSMTLAVLAWYFGDSWKTLSLVAAIPMVTSLFSWPFLPESPRWLLSKGRISDAKKSLDTIAKWNGYPPVDIKVVEKLGHHVSNSSSTTKVANTVDDDSEKYIKSEKSGSSTVGGSGYWIFMTNSALRAKIGIFIIAFFTVSIICYGIVFNLKNLGGSTQMNLIYLAILESIGFKSAFITNKWFGRRNAYRGYMLLGSCQLVGIMLMELNIGIPYNETGVTCLALVGRFFIGGGWASVKGFAGESFSTENRSTAMGITTIAAALGGIAAPQMVFLGTIYRPIPYFVFGTLAVVSTFLSLLLPETGGKPLLAD